MPGLYTNRRDENQSIKVCDHCRHAIYQTEEWRYAGEVVPQATDMTYTCGWCNRNKRYRKHDYTLLQRRE